MNVFIYFQGRFLLQTLLIQSSFLFLLSYKVLEVQGTRIFLIAPFWIRAAPKNDLLINCTPAQFIFMAIKTVVLICSSAGHDGRIITGVVALYAFSFFFFFCFCCGFFFFLIDFNCFLFQVVRKMMWLMDHVFKYTNFGLVSLIHGDFFIRQVRNAAGFDITSVTWS